MNTSPASRRLATFALLTLFAVAVMWVLVARRQDIPAATRPELEDRAPTSVDLELRGQRVATITNSNALLALLREGRAVPAHECSSPGKIVFHQADGRMESVDILPGHTGSNYEFICANGYFAVPRPALLSVLASCGVDTNQMPTE